MKYIFVFLLLSSAAVAQTQGVIKAGDLAIKASEAPSLSIMREDDPVVINLYNDYNAAKNKKDFEKGFCDAVALTVPRYLAYGDEVSIYTKAGSHEFHCGGNR